MPRRQTVMLNASDAGSLINFRGKLIEELVASNFRVHLTAPNVAPEVYATLNNYGATVHQVPLARTGTNPLSDLRYAFSLFKIMRAIRPDRVIGYTIKPNIWGSIVARLVGTRSASMVTGLGLTFIPGAGWRRRLLQTFMQSLYALATRGNDRVVFQNPDDREDFVAAGCLADPNKAVLVNGSGVDIDHFAAAPIPDAPVFLMIARLLVSKGVREYAEAALAVLRERSDCSFLLVGFIDDGPDAISQRDLDGWIAGGIRYLGTLDDVRIAIEQASVYVLPSYREGTPRSVLEAMAMARPVITTDVPGCRETVTDGVNGYLVPARDSVAVQHAMLELANSPALRTQFGAAGRSIAVSKYAVERVNRALRKCLDLEEATSNNSRFPGDIAI